MRPCWSFRHSRVCGIGLPVLNVAGCTAEVLQLRNAVASSMDIGDWLAYRLLSKSCCAVRRVGVMHSDHLIGPHTWRLSCFQHPTLVSTTVKPGAFFTPQAKDWGPQSSYGMLLHVHGTSIPWHKHSMAATCNLTQRQATDNAVPTSTRKLTATTYLCTCTTHSLHSQTGQLRLLRSYYQPHVTTACCQAALGSQVAKMSEAAVTSC